MGSLGNVDEAETYDYVVCGGGTAGCVLAARLAEDQNASVLLIEAGKLNTEVPASSMPGGVPLIVGTENEWNIKSEPTPGLDNRSIDLIRGKFLGGSSGCNGTLAIRGSREDFDQWEVPGWSGDEVFEYMNKAECFHATPWFDADKSVHGTTGPLHIAPNEPCPLSRLMLEAYQEKGFPLIPDVFSTGESPHACGHAMRTVYQGKRYTGADFLTERHNLHVKTNVFVNKVLLERTEDGKQRATGVLLQGLGGEAINVNARREVLLSGGAFGSPAILLRSGIGPKEELEAVGISSLVDLKGVGKNLMDHPLALIFYEVSKPGITTDHLIWHDGAQDRSMAEYEAHKTGFFSQFPFGTFAFARLNDRLSDCKAYTDATRIQQEEKERKKGGQSASNDKTPKEKGRDGMNLTAQQPHVEMWNTECYGPHAYADTPSNDKHAFAMIVTLFSAQSRGSVTISSADPTTLPVVNHNHLSDPRDAAVLAEGCRLANEIVTQSHSLDGVVVGGWPKGAVHHEWKDRASWEGYVRANANTCYHPSGTCKMSSSSTSTSSTSSNDELDTDSVVTPTLHVRGGITNLRVVDASIIPQLMGGHPQMAVYAIAEKGADLVKEMWR